MRLSFKALVRNAVADIMAQGYDKARHDWAWWILLALRRDYPPTKKAAERLTASYQRATQHGAIKKIAPHAGQQNIDRIKYKLAQELNDTIRAADDIINLHRQTAEADVQRRFIGWASSDPTIVDQRQVTSYIVKPMVDLTKKENNVITDQKRKLERKVATIIAKESGAIAGIWHSNFREPDYNYREVHKEHDLQGTVFLLPDNWATQNGWAKKTKHEQPGELPNCKCYYRKYIYKLKDLPEHLLTAAGREKVENERT